MNRGRANPNSKQSLCVGGVPLLSRVRAESREVSESGCFHLSTIRLCLASQGRLSLIKFYS